MRRLISSVLLLACSVAALAANAPRPRWTAAEAQNYWARQPYAIGANYLPRNAINELQMWQAASFDPSRIDEEFGWAQAIGMTTMRIFLHDLLWQQDAAGFLRRMDQVLAIAQRHGIKPVFVLFDSCWDPEPKLGPQHPPIPGVHNSGWVQSPGIALGDDAQQARLEAYVKGVVGHFAADDRILAWDVWNEPDNDGGGNYRTNLPDKIARVDAMLPRVFAWARFAGPVQPLTSGVWHGGHYDDPSRWNATERIQLTESDVVSFHDYGWPEEMDRRIVELESLHRPLLCTEYMARGNGSTFDGSLPVLARHHVGAINWGLVNGLMRTDLPWDRWKVPYTDRQPPIWFHDVFYGDGRPYRDAEVELIRRVAADQNAPHPAR